MLEPAALTPDLATPLHILVYGSDVLQRRSVARAFAAHGITVLLASSLAETAKCVRDGALHAAVLLDGIAVLHAVHEAQPSLQVLWAGAAVADTPTAPWYDVLDTTAHVFDAHAIVRATLLRLGATRRP